MCSIKGEPMRLQLYSIILIFALLFLACSIFGPTDEAIQTAIAQTQIAINTEGFDESNINPTEESIDLLHTPVPVDTPEVMPTIEIESEYKTGTILWSVNTPSHAYSDSSIFIGGSGVPVKSLDFETGSVIWTSDSTGRILGADNDFVYITSSDMRIDALEHDNGSVVWKAFLELPIEFYFDELTGEFFMSSTSLYVPVQNGNYIGINKQSGQIIGILPNINEIVFSDEVIVFEDRSGDLYGYATDSARKLWEISSDEMGRGSFLLCESFSYFYSFVEGNDRIEAINNSSGEIMWNIPRTGIRPFLCFNKPNKWDSLSLGFLAPPFGHYIEADSNNIFGVKSEYPSYLLSAIDRSRGEVIWDGLNINKPDHLDIGVQRPDYEWLGEVNGKVVYTHKGFGITVAYDSVNHEMVWENTNHSIRSIVGETEGILLGVEEISGNKFIVGIDAKSGIDKWRHGPFEVARIVIFPGLLLFPIDKSSTMFNDEQILTFVEPQSGQTIAELELTEPVYFFTQVQDYLISSGSKFVAVISK